MGKAATLKIKDKQLLGVGLQEAKGLLLKGYKIYSLSPNEKQIKRVWKQEEINENLEYVGEL